MSEPVIRALHWAWRAQKRSQWWRYSWAWGILIGLFLLTIVSFAPNASQQVMGYVKEETKRMGQKGIALNELDQPTARESRSKSSTMFGNKKLEGECREFLEETFGVPFSTVRPDFLKRPYTKRNLELDGYNADLKLAFEYQGPQHRVYLPMYHPKGEADFYAQLERDSWKLDRCKQLGIDLIVVPDTVPRSELRSWLYSQLVLLGRG